MRPFSLLLLTLSLMATLRTQAQVGLTLPGVGVEFGSRTAFQRGYNVHLQTVLDKDFKHFVMARVAFRKSWLETPLRSREYAFRYYNVDIDRHAISWYAGLVLEDFNDRSHPKSFAAGVEAGLTLVTIIDLGYAWSPIGTRPDGIGAHQLKFGVNLNIGTVVAGWATLMMITAPPRRLMVAPEVEE